MALAAERNGKNKSKKILNFKNKVSLEKGIKKTIKWIKNNKKFYNID